MAVELFDLEAVRVVARLGSITRAAISLHMAQPSLSQRIMALEEELGQPLFERHRRGVIPTEAGQRLVEYANRAIALIAEGVDVVKAMSSPTMRIKIAGPPSINSHVLPVLLGNLMKCGHEVFLHDGHSHEVIQLVQDGSIHAGFVLGGVMPPGIVSVEILRDPIVCVQGEPADRGSSHSLTLANLAIETMVLFPFSMEYPEFKEALSSALLRPLDDVPEITPAASVRELLLSETNYYSFLPLSAVVRDVSEGRLHLVPLTNLPSFYWSVQMVYKNGSISEHVIAALSHSIREVWGVDVQN